MRLPSPETPVHLVSDWLGAPPDPSTSLFDLHEVIEAKAARRWPRHPVSVGYDHDGALLAAFATALDDAFAA